MNSSRYRHGQLNPQQINPEGFTLIELLVTIVIVGVLSTVALPSFLNQVGKARGTEAKSNIGSINRSQQAYRFENNTFASTLTSLESKTTGKFYSYNVNALGQNDASVSVSIQPSQPTDLKQYSSAIKQNGDAVYKVICESLTNNSDPGTATANSTGGNCDPTKSTRIN
jgi:type IV pilus assembly protein PilA